MIPSQIRISSRRPLGAVLLLLAAACGGEPGAPGATAPSPPSVVPGLPRADSREQTPRVRRVGGRIRSLPAWGNDLRRRIEPGRDEEPLERAAVVLEQHLAAWIEALLAGGEGSAVEVKGLFPESLATRFEDQTTRVSRAMAGEPALSGEALRERLGTAPWDGLAQGDARVRLEALRETADETYTATALVRVVARDAERTAQLNARWRVEWSGLEAPRLSALEGLEHELLESSRPWFQDITLDVFGGLPFWDEELALGCEDYHQRTDQRVEFFYVGILGVALGDANGDGLEDLYLSQLGGLPNRLLLHQADGSVRDGSRAAGVDFLDTTRGALFVDLDEDGDQDLCVARQQDLVVCWNDGTGKFGQRSTLSGGGRSPIYSLSAADADGDGDLDLYGCRYPSTDISGGVPTPYHDAKNGVDNVYWRNDGERSFSEVALEVGLAAGDKRFSYVSIWEDLDGDGDLDLYVVNDYGANQAYLNQGGVFEERASELGLTDVAAGMGISVADVELDGDLDLYVSNMYSSVGRRVVAREGYRSAGSAEVRGMHRQHAAGNALLVRSGARYEEVAERSGCAPGDWSWGAIFLDWNADGLPDVYVPNGFISGPDQADVEGLFWRRVIGSTPDVFGEAEPYRRGWAAVGHFSQFETFSWSGYQRNYAYLNLGQGEFADASGLSRADFLDDGRVAARVDWDGDGQLDLLLVNRTGPRLRLLRGRSSAATVTIELDGGAGGRDAIGALVTVERSDGRLVQRRVYAGEGLLGESTRRLVFGLGEADGPLAVSVRWPDGEQQSFEGLAARRRWLLTRGEAQAAEHAPSESPFAGRAESPARAGEGGAPRTVLPEKMPLAALSLPRPDGGRTQLAQLVGSPLLLTYYDADAQPSRAFFEGLARARDELFKCGARVVPIELPGGASDSAWLAELGFAELAVHAATNDEQVLQALLIEVLGAYRDLDLPLSLLCDAGGNLVAIHYASSSPERVLRDLRKVKYLDPEGDSTSALSGGRWIRRPRRQFGELARVLQMLGARELAQAFAQRARGR